MPVDQVAPLPCMREVWTTQARGLFNPCEFHRLVYLCGSGSTSIEAYEPHCHVFFPLHFHLPENSACIVYLEHKEIVVRSENYVTRIRTDQRHYMAKPRRVRHVTVFSSLPPVVVAGEVYVVENGRFCRVKVEEGVKEDAVRK